MNQIQIIYTCTFDDHENEPIISFCINLQCKEKPQSCVNCLFKKHRNHQDDCKTIKKIKQILEEDIKFIEEWIQKEQENNNCILITHHEVVKLLNCQKSLMIEFLKKLQSTNYLYDRDLNFLREKAGLFLQLESNPEIYFQNVLEHLIIFVEAILSFEKFEKQQFTQMSEKGEEKDGQIQLQNYQSAQSDLLFMVCQNKECYLNIQCCSGCVIINVNEINNIFLYVTSVIQYLLRNIDQWILTELKIFEKSQRLYLFVKQFLENKKLLFKDRNTRLENEEFQLFVKNFNNIKEWLIMKQALFQKNVKVFEAYLIKMKILLGALSIFNTHNEETSPLSIINLNALQETIRCHGLLVGMHEKCLQMFFDKANSLYEQNEYLQSIQNFDQTIRINPRKFEAYFCKGNALSSLNRFTEASLCYDQAIKIKHNYFEAFNNKGNALDELQRYEETILCYDQAIKYNSTQSEAFNNKGIVLQKLKKYEEAVQCYDQAISNNPKFSEAFYNKGLALYNLDKYEDANLCFDQVVEFNQFHCEALNNKGLALNKLSRYEEAIQCFNKAIIINEKFLEAYNNKGAALNFIKRKRCYHV